MSVLRYILLIICVVWCVSCEKNPQQLFEEEFGRGDSLYGQQRYGEAIESWKAALAWEPENISALKKIADLQYLRTNYSEAKGFYQKVVDLAPQDEASRLTLARLYLMEKNFPEAAAHWEQLKMTGPSPEEYVFLGDLRLLDNQLGAALEAYRKASELDPKNIQFKIKIASCLFVSNGVAPPDIDIKTVDLPLLPETASTWLEIGNYWKLRGMFSNAEKAFKNAVESHPENFHYRRSLAEFYFDEEHYDGAAGALEAMIAIDPLNLPTRKFYLEVLMAQGNLDKCEELFASEPVSGNFDIEFNVLKGKYHLMRRESSFALAHFSAALEKEPDLPILHYLSALAHISDGNINLARESAVEALRLDPYFSQVELLLSHVYFLLEDYDFGIEHARRICEREPENFRAHMILGNLMLASGDHQGAVEQFGVAWKINPESYIPLYYAAIAHRENGTVAMNEQAVLSLLLESKPDVLTVAKRYADGLLATGDVSGCEQFLKKTIKSRGENPGGYFLLGEFFWRQGQLADAKAALTQAIALKPDVHAAYMRLAGIYSDENDWGGWLSVMEACIANNPTYLPAIISLAEYYFLHVGNKDRAFEILLDGLDKNPDSPELLNSLAWLYQDKDLDVNKAFFYAQKAYEKSGDSCAIKDTLGWIYYKKKTFVRAEWLLEEALQESPQNPIVHYHFGLLMKEKKQAAMAEKHLHRAVELGLAGPDLVKARVALGM